MIDESQSVARVRTALTEAGATGEVRLLSESARTAVAAAAALGCEVGAIANSLVFDAAGMPILILTSGAHRVDTSKVAHESQVPELRRAKPDFVREHTGQPIGGVAPVGHTAKIRTFVDRLLADYDVIWAAAGHPNAVFATDYPELVRITGGTPIDVADAPVGDLPR